MANFTPIADIRSFLESGTLPTARTAIGLGSVDNTADIDKPISNPTKVVTDAITARDWVFLNAGSSDEADLPSTYDIGQLSVMPTGFSPGGWPGSDDGSVYTDRRAANGGQISQYYYDVNGEVYHRTGSSGFPDEWSDFLKGITSTGGVIAGALTWSGQQEMTGQAATTAKSAMTRELVEDLVAVESFEILTTSGTIDLSKRNHYADPTSGDMTRTLPNSQLAASLGKVVTVKRVENGGNVVELLTAVGDSINGFVDSTIRISNMNEYTTLQAVLGIGWQELNRQMTAYASMDIQVADAATFSATTGFTKFTSWARNTFTTNQKVEANFTDSRIDIEHHTGSVVDAYDFALHITLEGTNNQFIEVQLYDQAGNPLTALLAVNGLGAGKPVTVPYVGSFLADATVTSVEVQILSESAQTLDISSAAFTVNRING